MYRKLITTFSGPLLKSNNEFIGLCGVALHGALAYLLAYGAIIAASHGFANWLDVPVNSAQTIVGTTVLVTIMLAWD